MKIKYFLLLLIVFFASFVRLYKISTLPPALFYDELDAGYQAMVFNQNTTDYFGSKFPLSFHSFGDYRTPLHIYTIAFFQRITNNTELSIRLPSAIFGIASVLLIFLITKSLIPPFLLAISPWAIHFSRIGFEVSGLIFLILLAIYFWQQFLVKNKFSFLLLALLFFCLTPYFYSTAKLFLLITALIILFIWRQQIFHLKFPKLGIALVFIIFLSTPLIIETIKGSSSYRFSYISIFTEPHREQVVDSLRYQDSLIDHPNEIGVSTTLTSFIFHNKYQLVIARFIKKYLSSFSTDFLLLTGDDNRRHGFGGHGLIYIIDIIFLIFGVSYFIFHRPIKKMTLFFGLLLIFSPIPFSLTRDSVSPHATRLILMLPSLIYFFYLGIHIFIKKKQLFAYPIVLIYFLSLLNFWHYYNYHYPNDSATDWNAGMKEAVLATNSFPAQKLLFSSKYNSFIPFFLFYHPYKLIGSISDHLVSLENSSFTGQVLDNQYYFGQINWTNLSYFPDNIIIIVPKSEFITLPQAKFAIIKEINKRYVNQEEFYLVTKLP